MLIAIYLFITFVVFLAFVLHGKNEAIVQTLTTDEEKVTYTAALTVISLLWPLLIVWLLFNFVANLIMRW